MAHCVASTIWQYPTKVSILLTLPSCRRADDAFNSRSVKVVEVAATQSYRVKVRKGFQKGPTNVRAIG
jgi:hypothetical protein